MLETTGKYGGLKERRDQRNENGSIEQAYTAGINSRAGNTSLRDTED